MTARIPLVCGLGVVGGTLPWTTLGKLHLTVFVKASFVADAQGLLCIGPPERIVYDDIPRDAVAGRSLVDHSDLVPYLAKTDVVMSRANAYGRPNETVQVAVGVRRGNAAFEKRLLARIPAGATSVALAYESAFGGPDVLENPVGTQHPALMPPDARHGRAVAFGAIARDWPARRELLRPADRRALCEPVMTIPEGFAWDFFHAAPADQRAPLLRGDEVFTLGGCLPHVAHAALRLPGVIGRARVYARGPSGFTGPPREVTLVIDTARLDPARAAVTLTLRGFLALDAGARASDELSRLVVAAGVGTADAAIAWPSEAAVLGALAEEGGSLARTLAGSGDDSSKLPLPFPAAPQRSNPPTGAPVPGAPWGPRVAPAPQCPPGFGTLAIGTEAPPPAPTPPQLVTSPQPVAPPQPAPPPPAPPAPAMVAERPHPPAPAPPAPAPPPPTPATLASRLRAAGASASDLAAIERALQPPLPPPDE